MDIVQQAEQIAGRAWRKSEQSELTSKEKQALEIRYDIAKAYLKMDEWIRKMMDNG